MKRFLYLFLTLSFLSTGCSKEDDIQITQQVSSSLDNNLIGIWESDFVFVEEQNSYTYTNTYYRSFSSNGNYTTWTSVYRTYNSDPTFSPQTYNESETSGTWWTEGDYLFFYDNLDFFQYNITNGGNTLTLTNNMGQSYITYIKQNIFH